MRGINAPTSSSQNTRKIRKILNEEIRLGINADSDSETEEVNLKQELFPLSHYINNREEMIEQMFSIIKGPKLKKMLPSILKDMPLEQLKVDCLIHLLGMSKKRIHAIMEARQIDSSSDSESHSDTSVTPNKKAKMIFKPLVIKQEGCSDISDNSEEVVLIDPDLDDTSEASWRNTSKKATGGIKRSKKHENSKRRKIHVDSKKKSHISPVEENDLTRVTSECDQSEESISGNEDIIEVEKPTEGKTLLEILELEMRARAIRALLHKGVSSNTESNEPSEAKTDKPAKHGEKCTEVSESQSGTDKITPKRNFRKKKKKNDDVIVITPKVVTIDLTDEHDLASEKFKDNNVQGEPLNLDNIISSVEESQEKNKAPRADILEKNVNVVISEDKKNNEECTANVCPSSSVESSMDNTIPSNADTLGKGEQGKNSWALRWLDSKEVKKVVSTSKICGNVRKKIKRSQLAKKTQNSSSQIITDTPEIEGTVNEFQSLPKSVKLMDVVSSNNTEAPGNASNEITLEGGSNEHADTPASVALSIDQVQDVTSTKNETSSENHIKEPTPSDFQANTNTYKTTVDITSNSETILVEESALTSDICKITSDIKILDCSSTSLEMNEANIETTVDKKPLESVEIEMNDNEIKHNDQIGDLSNDNLSKPDDLIGPSSNESLLSVAEENVKQDIYKSAFNQVKEPVKMECESNEIYEASSNKQGDDTKSQVLELSKSNINSSIQNLAGDEHKICRRTGPNENEPETLEININDDDEIDDFD